jgi:putative CocE/NonD family hydrolase
MCEGSKLERVFLLLLVLGFFGGCARQNPPASAEVRVEQNVQVPMRDGVNLAADIYFPKGTGPFPVLLIRTPYDKRTETGVGNDPKIKTADLFARHGYVVVMADSRGLYASHGEWHPYVDEARDGYDTQEWIGHQSWCNGKIGQWGISYPGYQALAAARYRSSFVKAIMPIGSQSDNFGSVWYTNGILHLAFALQWATMEEAVHQKKATTDVDWMKITSYLPIKSAHNELGIHSPFLADVVAHSTYDDFWRQMSLHDHYKDMDVPSFFVTGWFDGLMHETFTNFKNMRESSRSEHARRWQKLLVGPWGHGDTNETVLDGVDFGSQSKVDLHALELRWFDYQLKGEDRSLEQEPPIRVYVMGANQWQDLTEWPPASAQPTRLYLHSDGFANTRFGGGTLSEESPSDEPDDHYRYDPESPVPSFGGHGCCAGEMASFGPRDQRTIQGMLGVIVYTSKPLPSDTEIIGTPELKMSFSTDVPDTDFFVTLTDSEPNGRSNLITEGFLRTRFRDSLEKPTLLIPNRTYDVAIPLWETAYMFKAKHRIQLQITSSNFPQFDRNLNIAKRLGDGTVADIRVARQTIHHNKVDPSVLILPVISSPPSKAP